MRLKRRVALDGVQLDSLDNRILISGIDEAAGRDNISAVSIGAGNGQRITNKRRDTLEVVVRFTMAIRNDNMAARSALLDQVNAWASAGGWLTVGHRPGKRLNVILAQAPGGGDQFSWANEFTLTFRAYGQPYWEDTEATEAELTEGDAGTGTITVPGSAPTNAEVSAENTSGDTVTDFSITINGCTMAFSGISWADGDLLTIGHIQNGNIYVLQARAGVSSILGLKTGDDEFILNPGNNNISFSAGGDAAVTVYARGRYL